MTTGNKFVSTELFDLFKDIFAFELEFYKILINSLKDRYTYSIYIPETLVSNLTKSGLEYIFTNDHGILTLDEKISVNDIEPILSAFESKNRLQSADQYGSSKIPFAVIKTQKSSCISKCKVYDTQADALKAWNSLMASGTPAILQRYIFKVPSMPNISLTTSFRQDSKTEEAVKICETHRIPTYTDISKSKFKIVPQSRHVARFDRDTSSEIRGHMDELRRIIISSKFEDVNWDLDRIRVRHVYDRNGRAYLTDLLGYNWKFMGKANLKLTGDQVFIKYPKKLSPKSRSTLLYAMIESCSNDTNINTACSDEDQEVIKADSPKPLSQSSDEGVPEPRRISPVPRIKNWTRAIQWSEALNTYAEIQETEQMKAQILMDNIVKNRREYLGGTVSAPASARKESERYILLTNLDNN